MLQWTPYLSTLHMLFLALFTPPHFTAMQLYLAATSLHNSVGTELNCTDSHITQAVDVMIT